MKCGPIIKASLLTRVYGISTYTCMLQVPDHVIMWYLDSFADQLNKDQEDLNLFNMSYSSSTQGMSFDLRPPSGGEDCYADSTGEASISISTYFQKQSHSLGQPFSGKQPPGERVRGNHNWEGRVTTTPLVLNFLYWCDKATRTIPMLALSKFEVCNSVTCVSVLRYAVDIVVMMLFGFILKICFV